MHCTPTTTLHCTTTTPLHVTSLQPTTPFNFSAPPLLHCTHYTAPPLLHCTVLTRLHPHYSTALHWTVLTTLHHHYNTALHCTVLTTLHQTTSIHFTALQPNYSSEFPCTASTSLHLHYSTALYSLHFSTTTPQHGAVLYRVYTARYFTALHHHCTPLHFTARCSAVHCTSLAPQTSVHCNSLHGAVHFSIRHPITMCFTTLYSLPREGAHMHLHCDHDDSL